MTTQEAKEYMKNEIRCIQKASYCDRDCAKCELVKEEKPLLEAFEIAIKALEGYYDDCIIKHLSGGCSYNETGCSDCIGKEKIRIALEKQNAKKPTEIDEREEDDFYYLAFVCPSCHYPIHGQPYRPDYCKHCGQKLDWSNVNG